MVEHFPFLLALIVLILLLIMLADRLKVAYPVLLVIAGLGLSYVPSIPKVHIKPELIFIIFLPPLLYEAAFAISWKELWRWRRIVASFAFVVVFFTALSVAIVSSALIPGVTLALGLLLGGIVSPPDAVSASAILKFVKVPRRMASILEGESLLNDASSLIIFRFAIVAIATGHFVWYEAAASFAWMVIGGTIVGLAIGWLFIKAHRLLPTDANEDIILTLVTPYVMYLVAEEVHSSGVLAVVAGGLLLSYRRHTFLSTSARLRSNNVWQSLVFLLNGLVFMLIGLDLPEIRDGLRHDGIPVSTAVWYGLLVTLTLIVVRFIAAFGALFTTKLMSHFIQVADPNPGMKAPLLLGWTGMRGVVSLAAALSIPVYASEGVLFPHRHLILFITFIVILTTLILQGLTLPWMIRKVGLPDYGDHHNEEDANSIIKKGLAENALRYLNTNHADTMMHNEHLKQLALHWERKGQADTETADLKEHKQIHLALLEEQRQWLLKANKTESKLDEEVIRKFLYTLDLEEEKIKNI